ncbi:MAG: putative metal-binding motif-containing protein [Myxococcota bacterium]
MRTFLWIPLLLACACNGAKKDDLDGDGYTGALDCDEHDPKVHADAEEVCDGIDNDCDGTVDDGVAELAWPDLDGDGYGDATADIILLCEPRADAVTNDLDCDDTRGDVNPDQAEDCTEVDRNCDGSPTGGGTQLVYYDSDGDGFGDPDKPYTLCDAGPKYVDIAGDRDDADVAAYPGADELCNGRDDDCDFYVDEDAIDPSTLYVDGDGDGYGDPEQRGQLPRRGLTTNDLDCDDTSDQINQASSSSATGHRRRL